MPTPKANPLPKPVGKKKSGNARCPREAANGTFTEEFGTTQAGAAAAMQWLQKTRAWIETTFSEFCAHDADCPKTQIAIRVTSVLNPLTKQMSYTMAFRVICCCTLRIG